MAETKSAKAAYERAQVDRTPFLLRARRNASLTIPAIMPEARQSHAYLVEPYQSVGAEGVIHLSSRIMLVLLPPGRNFFRLDVPETAIAIAATDRNVAEQITEWRRQLAAWESGGQAVVDASNWRVETHAAVMQLLVTGNYLEYFDEESYNIKIYRLDQYVVKRDWLGNVMEIVLEEKMSIGSMSPQARSVVKSKDEDTKDIPLYTHMLRQENGSWVVYQEVDETEVPGSRGVFSPEEFPYNPVRYAVIPGEEYGRSKVEDHAPDLRSLELLEKSLREGASMSARHLIRVSPTASNLRNRIAKANNGDIITANENDISVIQFDTSNGMQIAYSQAERITSKLQFAFLLHRAAQRQAERVTATEINTVVEELENALGGVYSMLSHSLMEWRLNLLLLSMQRKGVIPVWTDGDIQPRVLTGLEALTRDRDVARVRTVAEIMQMFGDSAYSVVDVADLLRQAFIGLGLHDVTLSKEEQEAKEERQMALAATQQGMGKAVPGMTGGQ